MVKKHISKGLSQYEIPEFPSKAMKTKNEKVTSVVM